MAKRKVRIQPDIPIPEKGIKRSKYPLRELKVGDSIFVPCDDKYQHTVRSTVYSHAKRIGINVTLRRCFEDAWGLRIWREQDTQEANNENHEPV